MSTCPTGGSFVPWTAQFFLEIRQDSCEKNCLPAAQNPSLPDTSPIFKQALVLHQARKLHLPFGVISVSLRYRPWWASAHQRYLPCSAKIPLEIQSAISNLVKYWRVPFPPQEKTGRAPMGPIGARPVFFLSMGTSGDQGHLPAPRYGQLPHAFPPRFFRRQIRRAAQME